MTGPPDKSEAAAYYFRYIDRVPAGDVVETLKSQLGRLTATFAGISEKQSLHRYAPEKWSIRQLWNHVTDTERVFVFRALWFARGFEDPLPSYEQEPAVAAAGADAVRGRDTSRSFAPFARRPWLSSGICRPTPGAAAVSRAAIP